MILACPVSPIASLTASTASFIIRTAGRARLEIPTWASYVLKQIVINKITINTRNGSKQINVFGSADGERNAVEDRSSAPQPTVSRME